MNYNRTYVAPRPSRKNFKSDLFYRAARDEWKETYPNLHTEEEEAAHIKEIKQLAKRPHNGYLRPFAKVKRGNAPACA